MKILKRSFPFPAGYLVEVIYRKRRPAGFYHIRNLITRPPLRPEKYTATFACIPFPVHSRMDELTAESLIALHRSIMDQDGGDARLLSEASLHQMVFQANLMDTAFRRAACVLYWLCSYPVFREGNLQTALLATGIVLASEGYETDFEGKAILQLTEGIGSFAIGMDDVEDWLRTHSRRRA